MRAPSSYQVNRLRAFPCELTDSARWQCHEFLESSKRIVLGMHHYRRPIIRPGQWVRFIGEEDLVQGRDRAIPRVGSYGQVWRSDRSSRARLFVVFLGSTRVFRLGIYELEPLVGTPIGRPTNHLRLVKRRIRGERRREIVHSAYGTSHDTSKA